MFVVHTTTTVRTRYEILKNFEHLILKSKMESEQPRIIKIGKNKIRLSGRKVNARVIEQWVSNPARTSSEAKDDPVGTRDEGRSEGVAWYCYYTDRHTHYRLGRLYRVWKRTASVHSQNHGGHLDSSNTWIQEKNSEQKDTRNRQIQERVFAFGRVL